MLIKLKMFFRYPTTTTHVQYYMYVMIWQNTDIT